MREVEDDFGESSLHLPDLLDGFQISSVHLKQDGDTELSNLGDEILGVWVLEVAGLFRVEGGCEDLVRRGDERVGEEEGVCEGEVGCRVRGR